ncbi:MAG: glutathione synthase, partial [Pseudomonadota bacterium]
TTLAMLLAAQKRGWPLIYMEMNDMHMEAGQAFARMRPIKVKDDPQGWFELGEAYMAPMDSLSVILMRKDPPFDSEFVMSTYILERAEAAGALVVNKPASLRDANEKMFTGWFAQCCAPTLVTREASEIRRFLGEHDDIVVKPLDGMGGMSVFRIQQNDPNLNVIMETLTEYGTRYAMAQRYVPDIVKGDKRILLINGEPASPYALARLPMAGETRGNLAAGGTGEGVPLSDRDRWICEQVGPTLREKGLMFVGLDVIGDYLTEINVTSPTCVRELDKIYDLDIASKLMDAIEERLNAG